MSDPSERTVFQFRNWSDFANSRTQAMVSPPWIPVPTRLDADWYNWIVSGNFANSLTIPAMLGVCIALALVASRGRGVLLLDDGQPHTRESLAVRIRLPIEAVNLAIDRLLELKILIEIPFVAEKDSAPPLSAPHVNGAANTEAVQVIPANAGKFEDFWQAWIKITGQSTRRSEARAAWEKHAGMMDLTQILACLESYAHSRAVTNGVIQNPDNWIRACAKENWSNRWPAAKREPGKSDMVEQTNELMRQRMAKGERPL